VVCHSDSLARTMPLHHLPRAMPGHDKLAIAMLRSKSKDLRLNSETHLSYIAESTFCFELTPFSRMKKLLNRLHSHITGMRVEFRYNRRQKIRTRRASAKKQLLTSR
jgi:hypothetical protein